MKAGEVAERSPERVRSVVDIWVHLIACSRVLRNALEHNVLWSNEENSGLAVRTARSLGFLAAKYEEIAADIGSGATTIRHPEIVWRNWQDDGDAD
jgi:hypothetical protein